MFIAIVGFALLAFGATDRDIQDSAAKISLVLEADSKQIDRLEPLFLKTTLVNRASTPLVMDVVWSSSTGSLRFDLKRGNRGWSETIAEGQGAVEIRGANTIIMPEQSSSTASIIFRAGDDFVFDRAERCSIRARTTINGKEIVSNSIEVRVDDQHRSQQEFITRESRLVCSYLLPSGYSFRMTDLRELDLAKLSDGGRTRDLIKMHQGFANWQAEKPASANKAKREHELLENIKTSVPVIQQYYYNAVTGQYIKEGRLEPAKITLKMMESSPEKASFEREIQRKASRTE